MFLFKQYLKHKENERITQETAQRVTAGEPLGCAYAHDKGVPAGPHVYVHPIDF